MTTSLQPALIIIAREIVISALREWMAEVNRSGSVRVGLLAKVKTGVQMTAIACLLIAEPGEVSFWLVVGYLLIYVAAILTVWSMVKYLIVAWPSGIVDRHGCARVVLGLCW